MQMWDDGSTGHLQIHGKINASLHFSSPGPTKQNRSEINGDQIQF